MPVKAGKLRPSQAVTQFGPGSLVDLPTMSMVVAGADEWSEAKALPVDEPRLARRLRVSLFRQPPFFVAREGLGGIKARLFPEFLVCPRCNRLAPHQVFEFDPRRKEHLCKAPKCGGRGKAVAYPARFMVACPSGHLDDFPWHAYVHEPGTNCEEELRLEDSGQTGAITDLWVKCLRHDARKNLGQAFGRANRKKLPLCRGRRPWLGDHDPEGCSNELHVLLRGASNAYFPIVESAISVPPWSDPVQIALGPYVDLLAKVDSLQKLEMWRELNNAPDLNEFPTEQLWDALDRRRSGKEQVTGIDLRLEEWRAFQKEPLSVDETSEFRSRTVRVPTEAQPWVSRVAIVERLREVRALRGFTRIDPIPDIGTMHDVEAMEVAIAPIMRSKKSWLPGVEFRGEGLLIQLDEESVAKWENSDSVQTLWSHHAEAQREWYRARSIEGVTPRPPRYLLLHGLSHLLLRQLALDSGYSSASLRERIYSSNEAGAEMAGLLIYTATADSEGSLGGLAEMGRPEVLGPTIHRLLEGARLCANDPLCGDREPSATGKDLNGAACHACLLVSETACEAGNHYLDRGVIVPTVANDRTAFFA